MKHVRVILNGKGAADPELRAAVERLRGAGQPVEVRVTWEQGDAARLAREALADGVEVLVAGGGDGTLHEVTNGILGEGDVGELPEMAIGILPLGTANDFARGCGVPLAPDEALELAVTGPPAAIDVARVNDRFFVNVASGGFGAAVTEATPDGFKEVVGGGAYALVGVVTAAIQLEPYPGRLELPDESVAGPFLVAVIGNGRQAGGGFEVAPQARLDDGLLDVVFVSSFSASRLGAVIRELQEPTCPDNRFVHYRQVPRCRWVLEGEAPVSLDGEVDRWQELTFEVVPRGLRVVLPEECPLVGDALDATAPTQ